jgi:hypothetical protein
MFPHPVLGQLGEHFCSVFTPFLCFLPLIFPLSAAKEERVSAPARANKNAFFILLFFIVFGQVELAMF